MYEDCEIAELHKVKDKVGYILCHYPATRNSDKLLWLAYMCVYHGMREYIGDEAYFKLKDFLLDKKVISYPSIIRMRADLQNNDGLYRADKEVEQTRIGRDESFREHFGSGDYEY